MNSLYILIFLYRGDIGSGIQPEVRCFQYKKSHGILNRIWQQTTSYPFHESEELEHLERN